MRASLHRLIALALVVLALTSIRPYLAVTHAAVITSLVSYWELNEASGTRNDAHSTNHLTDNNTVLSTTGKVGTAADFETSTSEYLSRASNSALQAGDIDFTFAAWINLESATSGIIASKDSNAGSSRDYTLEYSTGFGPIFYVNGSFLAGPGGTLSNSTWYFVVGWHDATANTTNLQIDNGTVNSTSTGGAAPDVSASQFRIGAREYSGAEGYFDGLIDEVGFWKKVLTPTERTWLYNAGAGRSYADIVAEASGAAPKSLLTLGVGGH